MADKNWKRGERRVAKYFTGWRIGPSGLATPDVLSATFAFEVKYLGSRGIPQWLDEVLHQARRNAPHDKLPVGLLLDKGRQVRDAPVLVNAQDLRAWFGT